jgi:hypothetical protein
VSKHLRPLRDASVERPAVAENPFRGSIRIPHGEYYRRCSLLAVVCPRKRLCSPEEERRRGTRRDEDKAIPEFNGNKFQNCPLTRVRSFLLCPCNSCWGETNCSSDLSVNCRHYTPLLSLTLDTTNNIQMAEKAREVLCAPGYSTTIVVLFRRNVAYKK